METYFILGWLARSDHAGTGAQPSGNRPDWRGARDITGHGIRCGIVHPAGPGLLHRLVGQALKAYPAFALPGGIRASPCAVCGRTRRAGLSAAYEPAWIAF